MAPGALAPGADGVHASTMAAAISHLPQTAGQQVLLHQQQDEVQSNQQQVVHALQEGQHQQQQLSCTLDEGQQAPPQQQQDMEPSPKRTSSDGCTSCSSDRQPPPAAAPGEHVVITVSPSLEQQQQQQQQPDQQQQPQGLARSHSSISSGAAEPARECRICLSADSQADLVAPCSCAGTMRHAHLACLKAWVLERPALDCELCGKPFREPVASQLKPLVDAAAAAAAAAAAGRRPVGGGLFVGGDGLQEVPGGGSGGDGDAEPPRAASWVKFWIHLGILVLLLIAVLHLALFVHVEDKSWLVVVWRAITIVLPLVLIVRCLIVLYAWRRARNAAAAGA